MVPVPTFEKVMVPVPTFKKLRFRFRFQLHIYTIKSKFFKKNSGIFLPLPEGNQIYNFISSSGSHFLTSYGSGSTSQNVTVPTVPVPFPVPQRCLTVDQRELEHGEKVAGGHEHHRLGAHL
jgi:hypothetical protein